MAGGAERIRAAALELFAEAGYEGVSMSEIAGAAGIKTPSIYAHFASKEALFLELFDEAVRHDVECVAWLSAEQGGRSASERLEAIFAHYTDPVGPTAGQMFLRRTMLMPPKKLRDRMQRAFLAYEARLTDVLRSLIGEALQGGGLPERTFDRHIAHFYALIDGLLLEQQWYGGELYRVRQRMGWEAWRDGLQRG